MERSVFNILQTKLHVEEKLDLVYSALLAADILNRFDSGIKEAALKWAEGKDILDFAVNGTTVDDIIFQLNCSQIAALCILQAVSVNPESFADAVLKERIDYNGQ